MTDSLISTVTWREKIPQKISSWERGLIDKTPLSIKSHSHQGEKGIEEIQNLESHASLNFYCKHGEKISNRKMER
jgi:hypothetical protein